MAPIEEALSHSSLGESRNHEQLEFLGDAVLRLAATEFLRREQAGLRVGDQSVLRGQLVSDRWLAVLGQSCGLRDVVRLGPMAAGDAAGFATVLAECTEALLGGIYLAWGGPSGGLEPVIHWLTPHWHYTTKQVLADPHRQNWKSALQEWSQRRGLGLPHYICQEQSLAHGDPRRFHCTVQIEAETTAHLRSPLGIGWGSSQRKAHQQAARDAMEFITGTDRSRVSS